MIYLVFKIVRYKLNKNVNSFVLMVVQFLQYLKITDSRMLDFLNGISFISFKRYEMLNIGLWLWLTWNNQWYSKLSLHWWPSSQSLFINNLLFCIFVDRKKFPIVKWSLVMAFKWQLIMLVKKFNRFQ